MCRFHLLAALGLTVLGLGACGPLPRPPPPNASAAPREQLSGIVDRYWEAYLQLNPAAATESGDHRHDDRLGDELSPRYLADSLALERGALAELEAVPRPGLDAASALTYDIFKRGRELAIDGFTYPEELMPDPIDGMPQHFEQLGSGTAAQPFASIGDYEHWMARMDDYAAWTSRAVANMREGLRRGYSLPRDVVEHSLAQLARAAEDTPQGVFYLPLRAMPAHIAEPARSRLAGRFTAAVRGKVLPAYRQLHDFLASEYLPRARSGAALAAFPLGDAWYAHRVRLATDGGRTPAEIHALGLEEVERVRARIQDVLAANGAGDLQSLASLLEHEPPAPANPEILLDRHRDLKARVATALAALFPAAAPEFEIRTAEYAGAPAMWIRAAQGPNPGAVLYVNPGAHGGAAAGAAEPLFLHYAIPGRLYQAAIPPVALPKFRRFGAAPAFVEGWALYAETLGEELGLYGDLYAKLAALLRDLNCSAALVVDTGLQSQHWTRRRAFDYLRTHTPMDDAEANVRLDRASAAPGTALAAKIGELKILALRARAQQSLGARFDLRAFHAAILAQGPMPLDILDAQIVHWIATVR